MVLGFHKSERRLQLFQQKPERTRNRSQFNEAAHHWYTKEKNAASLEKSQFVSEAPTLLMWCWNEVKPAMKQIQLKRGNGHMVPTNHDHLTNLTGGCSSNWFNYNMNVVLCFCTWRTLSDYSPAAFQPGFSRWIMLGFLFCLVQGCSPEAWYQQKQTEDDVRQFHHKNLQNRISSLWNPREHFVKSVKRHWHFAHIPNYSLTYRCCTSSFEQMVRQFVSCRRV